MKIETFDSRVNDLQRNSTKEKWAAAIDLIDENELVTSKLAQMLADVERDGYTPDLARKLAHCINGLLNKRDLFVEAVPEASLDQDFVNFLNGDGDDVRIAEGKGSKNWTDIVRIGPLRGLVRRAFGRLNPDEAYWPN